MALTNLLKIIPLNLTENSQLNFPLKNSTVITLQKFVVKPSYNPQNISIFFNKILRSSSFLEDLKKLPNSISESQTSALSQKMDCQIANRRIAMTMLLMSIFVASSSTAFAASSEADFIKKTISAHKIVIFSKSYCPYCRRAKEVFKELDQAPHVIELDERDDGYSIQDALGGIVGRRTVPQVFINGKHIGGADDTIEAYQNGELAKLLGIKSTGRDDL